MRVRLETLLASAAKGVAANAAATPQDVLTAVHSALTADLNRAQAAKQRMMAADALADPDRAGEALLFCFWRAAPVRRYMADTIHKLLAFQCLS